MKIAILTLLLLFNFGLISAQWTNNPATNLLISDLPGDQTLPLIAPTSDGGCYIVWFDNRSGSYSVYLQKLTPTGTSQFAQDGLLISSNPQSSSLVGYDMKVDANDNAIIVFTDQRNGSTINPFAYKISPSGNFDWGANGVNLTDAPGLFQPNPKIAVTSDGFYVFTWIYTSSPRQVAMQKLDAAGNKMWGNDPLKISGTPPENLDWPGIVPSDNGSVILLWSGYTGSFLNPMNYRLYSQKFSSSGTPEWNATQDTVYNLGRVSGFYNPRIFPDGNNGALYCWQDDRDNINLSYVYTQRYSSAGQRQFPLNGTKLTTQPSQNNYTPVGTVVNSTQETYVFWSVSNAGQTLQGGLYGQKLNSNGDRQWSDNGHQFKPLDNNTFSGLGVYAKDTTIVVSFNETQFGGTTAFIKAFSTGPTGLYGWGGSVISASTNPSEKVGFNSNMTSLGMSLLVWSDRRSTSGGIYAQNINLDGTLGGGTGITNTNEIAIGYSLSQNYPNPFNPVTKINFSLPTAQYTVLKVYNSLGQEVTTLIDQKLNAGTYSYNFNAEGLNSGVYFYTLITNEYQETRKMVLLK